MQNPPFGSLHGIRPAGETRDVDPMRAVVVTPAPERLTQTSRLREWARLLRVHQYAKNALVFVPFLTAHAFTVSAFSASLLAAAAFSLCASAIYIVNDIIDLESDRSHPTKCRRPLAAGTIPIRHGMVAVPLLIAAALAIAAMVSLPVGLLLVVYLALTTLYSLWLKRKLLLDVVILSLLYTMRVVVGAVAIGVDLSEWLLAFSLLIFTSLALIKRHTELTTRLSTNMGDATNRDYSAGDLSIVGAMAAAAGFNAVTLFALYASSDTVGRLYSHPQLLWLICPVLLYWIGRALVLAHRQMLHDDPIVFALKDKASYVCLGVIVALMLAAI